MLENPPLKTLQVVSSSNAAKAAWIGSCEWLPHES